MKYPMMIQDVSGKITVRIIQGGRAAAKGGSVDKTGGVAQFFRRCGGVRHMPL